VKLEKEQASRFPVGVVVTGGISANSLGVVRAFGRRNAPVVYVDSEPDCVVKYSRYITRHVGYRHTEESGDMLVKVLTGLGKELDGKMLIVPTNDRDVMVLSKHRGELEKYYYLPVPSPEIVQRLVNKRDFYTLLEKMQVPHPKTYFLEHIDKLRSVAREIGYPFIVKPALSLQFQMQYGRKNFVITSDEDLGRVARRLKDSEHEVMAQEIIPGKEIYAFYAYLNRKSEPLALCGYDKLRHYPDFGMGTCCRSILRKTPTLQSLRLLKETRYFGFAEPEVIKDPRDGQYKLIEINARTTLQNRLAAACGVDVEYTAYLDASGKSLESSTSPREGVFWVDDFMDLLACFVLLRKRRLSVGEMLAPPKTGTVHSFAALDDPAPYLFRAKHLARLGFSLPFRGFD